MRILLAWILLLWVGLSFGEESSKTSSKTSSKSKSSSSSSRATKEVASQTIIKSSSSSSASHDSIIQLLLIKTTNETLYYFADSHIGNQSVTLRLDLLLPDVWAFNANEILDCDDFFDWYQDHTESVNESILPPITMSRGTYDGSLCYYGDAYTTTDYGNANTTAGLQTPTKTEIYNDETATVNYPPSYDATGVMRTDYLSLLNQQQEFLNLANFSFVLVDNTSLITGGIGLMLHPLGSGLLDTLKSLDFIDAASYSLILGSNSSADYSNGYLLPGVVDQSFYEGDFYQYDIPSYTGLYDDLDNSVIFPAVELDDVRIKNQDTQQSVTVKTDTGAIPIVIDSQGFYTYLPLNVLINVAIQLNAVYNPDLARWIVECDSVRDTNAYMEFVFGNLTIPIELEEFLLEAYTNESVLTFANGKQACFLSLLPASMLGYSCLGISFLERVYMAVDNEGGKIAFANRNSDLDLQGDAGSDQGPSDWSFSSSNITSHSTVDKTIAYIQSGSIPFATVYNQSAAGTLTFSPSQVLGPTSIPAKFSGSIRSGEVVVTGNDSIIGSFTEAASAARENSTSTKNGAEKISNPLAHYHDAGWNKFLTWSSAIGMGGFFIAVLFW